MEVTHTLNTTFANVNVMSSERKVTNQEIIDRVLLTTSEILLRALQFYCWCSIMDQDSTFLYLVVHCNLGQLFLLSL